MSNHYTRAELYFLRYWSDRGPNQLIKIAQDEFGLTPSNADEAIEGILEAQDARR